MVGETSGDLTPWFVGEKKVLDQAQKDSLAKADLKPFIKLGRGENVFEILNPRNPPRDYDGKFGPRKIFRVRQKGIEYDWGVNPRSPIYRAVIDALVAGKPILCVLREGSGKEVKDVLKSAKSNDTEAFL